MSDPTSLGASYVDQLQPMSTSESRLAYRQKPLLHPECSHPLIDQREHSRPYPPPHASSDNHPLIPPVSTFTSRESYGQILPFPCEVPIAECQDVSGLQRLPELVRLESGLRENEGRKDAECESDEKGCREEGSLDP